MHSLLAETVAFAPHLETAGELALKARDAGNQPSFAWLGDNLPWTDWELPRIARLAGCSLAPRVKRFEELLAMRGINVLPHLVPDAALTNQLQQWVQDFSGDLDALKAYHFEGAKLGMGVASSLISWTRDSQYNPATDMARVRAVLGSSALVYGRAIAAIEATKPDQLITFNGRFSTCKPIVEAGNKLGIPVLRHERGHAFDYYECFHDQIHNFAYIRERIGLAWNAADPTERTRLGHQYFERRLKGDGIYWYSFTKDQERGRGLPPAQQGKRRVVYYNSSDDEYAAVSDVFTLGHWPNQLSAVRDLIKICESLGDIELVIRMHPNLAKSPIECARWNTLKSDCLTIIAATDPMDSYALLASADMVVCYGSSIGIEATYAGKPTILLGPCFYQGLGVAHEPADAAALQTLLRPTHNLPPIDRERCLPYGHYYLTFGTKFTYYKPTSFAEGTFLGERLGWDPDWVHWLRKQGVGKLVRKAIKRT